ncbi:hypothetical protein B5F86_14445 [Lachnoclostridium sp. An298]|jgi:hypothetical protein|nr:hypothetical protein B5F86_14445 [Lachnoclostridium sp. An298]
MRGRRKEKTILLFSVISDSRAGNPGNYFIKQEKRFEDEKMPVVDSAVFWDFRLPAVCHGYFLMAI